MRVQFKLSHGYICQITLLQRAGPWKRCHTIDPMGMCHIHHYRCRKWWYQGASINLTKQSFVEQISECHPLWWQIFTVCTKDLPRRMYPIAVANIYHENSRANLLWFSCKWYLHLHRPLGLTFSNIEEQNWLNFPPIPFWPCCWE